MKDSQSTDQFGNDDDNDNDTDDDNVSDPPDEASASSVLVPGRLDNQQQMVYLLDSRKHGSRDALAMGDSESKEDKVASQRQCIGRYDMRPRPSTSTKLKDFALI
ncbi:hypothetical protein NDU88_004992 [Pleurodeles waltl]|uniref:Uncharacterized protein n=1 Tax=Pleurodeles waltl TaxID=8319 RepID=A0AAV7WTH4_PLEWA|nr:hypothetical protein NDU88_004992 [Pleurodeles waltl]